MRGMKIEGEGWCWKWWVEGSVGNGRQIILSLWYEVTKRIASKIIAFDFGANQRKFLHFPNSCSIPSKLTEILYPSPPAGNLV